MHSLPRPYTPSVPIDPPVVGDLPPAVALAVGAAHRMAAALGHTLDWQADRAGPDDARVVRAYGYCRHADHGCKGSARVTVRVDHDPYDSTVPDMVAWVHWEGGSDRPCSTEGRRRYLSSL